MTFRGSNDPDWGWVDAAAPAAQAQASAIPARRYTRQVARHVRKAG